MGIRAQEGSQPSLRKRRTRSTICRSWELKETPGIVSQKFTPLTSYVLLIPRRMSGHPTVSAARLPFMGGFSGIPFFWGIVVRQTGLMWKWSTVETGEQCGDGAGREKKEMCCWGAEPMFEMILNIIWGTMVQQLNTRSYHIGMLHEIKHRGTLPH